MNSECSVGAGSLRNGYRYKRIGGKARLLHRVVWESVHGPIPPEMYIDHMCRNRSCTNVDHLRLVTPRINSIENSTGITARNASKTHCVRGHDLTEHATVLSDGQRMCRVCKRERTALWRAMNPDRAKEVGRVGDAKRAKSRWQKIKSDPVALEAHRAQSREAARRSRQLRAGG